jgi:hypothetical protein
MKSRWHHITPHLWLAAVAIAFCLLWVDSADYSRAIHQTTELQLLVSPLPQPDRESASGWQHGVRRLVLPAMGLDGYHWIMQTQQMLAGHGARIRHVDYDNSPRGREVHWSSPFRWWLGGVARLNAMISGRSLPVAVEAVAPYANTLLLALLMLVLTPLTARRFGALAASLLCCGMVMVFPFYGYFMVGNPDHHGLAAVLALLSVLLLQAGGAGWVRAAPENTDSATEATLKEWLPDQAGARCWFAAAGMAAGCGLWISAATQVPVVIGTAMAALLGTWWFGRCCDKGSPWRLDPTLWRLWGWSGGVTSLLAYGIEYFPSHMGLRLEVNHPLYALALVAAGDLLCRASTRLLPDSGKQTSRQLAGLVLDLGAIALLPLVILFTKGETFLVADPFVWQGHKDYFAEFQSLLSLMKQQTMLTFPVELTPLPLVMIPLVVLIGKARLPGPWRALLLTGLIPATVTLLLSWQQLRWFGVSAALWLASLSVMAGVLARTRSLLRPGRVWQYGTILFLAAVYEPYAAYVVTKSITTTADVAVVPLSELKSLLPRDVAYWLRARVGDNRGVVLTDPASSTLMSYYGGFVTVGTLYWENAAGLKRAAAIYNAASEAEAYQLIREAGVSHIVIFSWSDWSDAYTRLARGLSRTAAQPPDGFMKKLQQRRGLPPWLQELHYPIGSHKEVNSRGVRIFQVMPPASR